MTDTLIDRDWAVMMARYNAWQNEAQMRAADALPPRERERDRGAFFGSIHGTMSHLLWADLLWLSRLTGTPAPEAGLAESPRQEADWGRLQSRRGETDAALAGWAAGLTDEFLRGEVRWRSASAGGEVALPAGRVVTHVFVHQVHHRGQIHAMLTAAGARPEATDLFLMPEGAA
ncbi:putative damage-inducible protein DinB [Hasllibacter halocynthiae]|uniref:Putative damage-inducible protein DinB n=1 Tax=Hasllibacter halocynthiae TaxID=595589 RepID=A0A2T0X740_9RHOB|nr:DinB family protein [Hasllibacter halocynthiae]PRY94705.1 putative damage-inducible protein DinB [Hasllibacter halocynthiae]